eukprot:scaffold564_cov64-Phaeocystis_antarctica.AAC.2
MLGQTAHGHRAVARVELGGWPSERAVAQVVVEDQLVHGRLPVRTRQRGRGRHGDQHRRSLQQQQFGRQSGLFGELLCQSLFGIQTQLVGAHEARVGVSFGVAHRAEGLPCENGVDDGIRRCQTIDLLDQRRRQLVDLEMRDPVCHPYHPHRLVGRDGSNVGAGTALREALLQLPVHVADGGTVELGQCQDDAGRLRIPHRCGGVATPFRRRCVARKRGIRTAGERARLHVARVVAVVVDRIGLGEWCPRVPQEVVGPLGHAGNIAHVVDVAAAEAGKLLLKPLAPSAISALEVLRDDVRTWRTQHHDAWRVAFVVGRQAGLGADGGAQNVKVDLELLEE